ncbi:MAG: phospholipid carrier-dependent glycosyltransferase [Thermodesulfobacteriota bacterium]
MTAPPPATRAALAERARPWLLAGVLLLALGLRLAGLGHGLPDWIVHCDTPKQLAQIPDFHAGRLDPGFSYPLGHIYLYSGVMRAWTELTGGPAELPPFDQNQPAPAAAYILAARALQCLLGVGAVLWVFFIGRALWGPVAGLLAALLLALDPLHLTYSRQVMGDAPQAFWLLGGLYLALRAGQAGGWWRYLLAGAMAGLAVSVKLYGGYVLIAGLAAWWANPPRSWRPPLLLLAGLALGWSLGAPLIWSDPATWLEYLRDEITSQMGMADKVQLSHDRLAQVMNGLDYLVGLLPRNYAWPWLLGGLAGLGWLYWRRDRRQWPLLAAAAAGLTLLALRLYYLREWDLVGVTPYLHLALAGGAAGLAGRLAGRPVWRRGLVLALAGLVVWQGLYALSYAQIARLPDTRHFARQWLASHDPPRGELTFDLMLSGPAAWLDPGPSEGKPQPDPLRQMLRDRASLPGADLAVVEWPWWEPRPGPGAPRPAMVFDLRNTYWENPEIAFYLPRAGSPFSRLLLAPPWAPDPPASLGFIQTAWARRQMLALGQPELPVALTLHPRPALDALGWLALGRGRARLGLGPWASLELDPAPDRPQAGRLAPRPSPLPLWLNACRLELSPAPGAELCLLLAPTPADLAPLLARLGLWAEMAALCDGLDAEAPAEAWLWRAAALARLGRPAEADQALAELNAREPGFLAAYRRLAVAERPDPAALAVLVRPADGPWWLPELAWSADATGPAIHAEADADRHHLWLPHTFVPGRLRLVVSLDAGPAPARLRVIAHRPGVVSADLAAAELPPGAGSPAFALEAPAGPTGLELLLEGAPGSRPRVTGYRIGLDWAAELAWRWRLLRGLLPAIDPPDAPQSSSASTS